MLIGGFIVWMICAGIVAAAAEARGRSGIGWFFLAVVISPLLALVLVLVSGPAQSAAVTGRHQYLAPPPLPATVPPPLPQAFEPDGVLGGVPYRVRSDGGIDAIMQGAIVRFSDYDRFIGLITPAK